MEWIREEPARFGSSVDSAWGGGGYADGTSFGGSGGWGAGSSGWGGQSYRKPAKKAKPAFGAGAKKNQDLDLAVGDKVNHDKYGLGTVKSVDGSGSHTTCMIDFGSQGTVRLMLFGGVPMEKL